MTDRYEEFKEWFMELENIPSKVDLTDTPFSVPVPAVYAELKVNKEKVFELFEEEQAKKETEKEIKETIKETITEIPLQRIKVDNKTVYCSGELVNRLYNNLKLKDLIK